MDFELTNHFAKVHMQYKEDWRVQVYTGDIPDQQIHRCSVYNGGLPKSAHVLKTTFDVLAMCGLPYKDYTWLWVM